MRLHSTWILPFLFQLSLNAQDDIHWKHRGPVWFSPARNTCIHGVSLGGFHFSLKPEKWTKINGISIEIGLGLLMLYTQGPSYSHASPKTVAALDSIRYFNRINGLSLSLLGEMVSADTPGEVRGLSLSGTMGTILRVTGVQLAPLGCANWEVRGLTAGILFHNAYRVKGAQIALLCNQSGDHRGLQIGLFNFAKKMRGVQIGLFNKARTFKGLQIGLWNTTKWGSLPLINWDR